MSVDAAIVSTVSPTRRPSGRTMRLWEREIGSSMSVSASRPLIFARSVYLPGPRLDARSSADAAATKASVLFTTSAAASVRAICVRESPRLTVMTTSPVPDPG